MDSDGPEIALADPTAGLSDGPIRCAQFSYATGLVLLPHSSNKRCGGVDRCYVVDQSNNTIRIVTGTVFGVL